MKKRILNFLLTFIPITTTLSILSCKQNVKFNQEDDNKIVIANSATEKSEANLAIHYIKDLWNQKPEVINQKEGYLPLEIQNINNGYNGVYLDLSTKLETRNKKDLYNIVFNYPSIISLLNKYNMTLDLSDLKLDENFSDKFLEINKQIMGIKKGIWFLPVARSTEINLINSPVFAYIMENALNSKNKNPAIIKNNILDQKFFEDIQLKARNQNRNHPITDIETVKNIWKDYQHFSKEEGGFGGFEFSKDIFNSYEGLFDLSLRIKKSFPKASDGNVLNKADNVLGMGSIANTLYSMFFSEIEGDYKKFLMFPDENNKKLNYKEIFKKNSIQYQKFQKIFNQIKLLMDNNVLFLRGKNNGNALNYLKNHQLVFAITSSARFKDSYVSSDKSKNTTEINQTNAKKVLNQDELSYIETPTKISNNSIKNVILSQGASMMALHANEKENKTTKKFIKWFISEKLLFDENLRITDLDNPQNIKLTPLEYFNIKTGYINLSKETLNKSEEEFKNLMLKNKIFNPFAIIAFNNFKKIQENNNYLSFEDPVDILSASFRKNIDLEFLGYIDRNKNAKTKETFNEFLKTWEKNQEINFKNKD